MSNSNNQNKKIEASDNIDLKKVKRRKQLRKAQQRYIEFQSDGERRLRLQRAKAYQLSKRKGSDEEIAKLRDIERKSQKRRKDKRSVDEAKLFRRNDRDRKRIKRGNLTEQEKEIVLAKQRQTYRIKILEKKKSKGKSGKYNNTKSKIICAHVVNANVHFLPCQHEICDECSNVWFENSWKCPKCKVDVLSTVNVNSREMINIDFVKCIFCDEQVSKLEVHGVFGLFVVCEKCGGGK